ncbi:MAG: DUF357 domain-containing protein [Desulfurococcaceae archaeon TW002]
MTLEDTYARIKSYIDMVEKTLKTLRVLNESKEVSEVIKLASLYLSDAKYYFSIGDYVTSLSCIAYSEGLLDALRLTGNIEFEWVREKPKKVLVGGTFDLLHPGHIHYVREAHKRGLVYAVVARDSVVRKIKGREPVFDEKSRLTLVSSLKYVYEAILGDEEDFMKPVIKVKPDIILLGPDQPIDENTLTKNSEKLGLNITVERLKERVGGHLMSTTDIVKEILRKYCINQYNK